MPRLHTSRKRTRAPRIPDELISLASDAAARIIMSTKAVPNSLTEWAGNANLQAALREAVEHAIVGVLHEHGER